MKWHTYVEVNMTSSAIMYFVHTNVFYPQIYILINCRISQTTVYSFHFVRGSIELRILYILDIIPSLILGFFQDCREGMSGQEKRHR